jgi:tight adherence protein C
MMPTLEPIQIAVIAGAIFVLSAAGFILLEMERRRRLLTRAISGKNGNDGGTGGGSRSQSGGFLHQLGAAASRMTMVGQKEIEQTEKTLSAAGYRSKGALYQLLGLRTVGLLLGLAGPAVWSQFFHPLAPLVLLPACIGGILFGWRAPMMVVGSMANRRRKTLDADLPNAIDLLIICGEAGLSIEAGVDRIVREMRRSCPELAREFAIVSAEMRILSDRTQAFVNLTNRIQTEGARSLSSTLSQASRYGTPLGKALRVLSKEMRLHQQLRMEERAASLPVLITLPMICFILPCVFIVVGGPAFMEVAKTFQN